MSSTLSRPTHPPVPVRRAPWLERETNNELTLESTVVRYNAGHGPNSYVSLQWRRNLHPKNTLTQTVTALTKPWCLTKEEVRGSKVERDICLPPTCEGGELLPGGLIDALKLLSTGRFHYILPGKRPPYSISITPDPASRATRNQPPNPPFTLAAGGGISPSATLADLDALKGSVAGQEGITAPNRSSSSEMCWSTFPEGMALHIGGSSFPMAPSSDSPFSLSAERYRHSYIYTFEQVFFSASASAPSDASALFTDGEEPKRNALFIQNVKFGRRLYVIVESEYALEKCAHLFNGSLEWIVLSAKLQTECIAAQARKHLSIRLLSQDGWRHQVDDYTRLERAIDHYFQSSSTASSLSPLSYQVCDLHGAPVSLVTTACLVGQQCLTSPKARVHLKSIAIRGSSPRGRSPNNGASVGSQTIYGSVNLHVVDEHGRPLDRNGQTMDSPENSDRVSAGSITIARREAPLQLNEGQPMEFAMNAQQRYIDVDLTSLDMTFEIEPFIGTSPHHAPGSWMTPHTRRQTLRQMMLEGSMQTTLQFHNGTHQLDITVDIQPL